MNAKNAKFQVTVVKPEQCPTDNLPEIALVGRSNVGKSSLINGLVGQKNLARVAASPGKTREINFYNVDQCLFLVDLPGYGYAKVSKEEKAYWQTMIEGYLFHRKQLRLILMLVDIRHSPSHDDQMMFDWIKQQNHFYIIVASKADKIPRSQLNRRLSDIRSILGMKEEEVLIPFSAVNGQGREEIWGQVQKMV